ncbi:MAG: bifunctional diaminohydroxyphosphoribosylaminopyrimidine deaminase/5-amino-6-(5-phosphoribosylamino)uracil reductase RibD [Proteobacteria bacterium]|nr:bifunctional diaminohydroxyphosphoribosylaminopyrimidine deaminase/5-amino-6-(5-phosphoribosylamino)uracil reductase RibD [Pseudomonadota bacterium]
MKIALSLAKKAEGRTSPNPMVGAVIVKNGEIVGKGYHKRAGDHHGEINALIEAGGKARGGELYINLEPCSHFGKTAPCADALIKAGIKKAFISMEDPNPQVSGEGIKRLRAAGIEVTLGLLEIEAKKLNEAFIKHITTGMPLVTLKAALSLDGRLATRAGDSKWVTGEKARRHVHRMRDRSDAILVGLGTVKKDDPSLTTRLPGRAGKDPVRVVLDERLEISPSAKIFEVSGRTKVIIATTDLADRKDIDRFSELGAEVLIFKNKKGFVPFEPLLKSLGKMGITSLLIEGGGEINASALEEGIVDKVAIFYAPKIIGGREAVGFVGGEGIMSLSDAIALESISIRRMGEDLLVEGYIKRSSRGATIHPSLQSGDE